MRVLVLLAGLALAAAAAAEATPPPGASMHGLVMRGPVTPVCAIEQPCDAPARGVTLVFTRNGRVFGRALTDAAGRYRLRLPAGVYTVRRGSVSGADRRLDPTRARARAGLDVRIDFHIDTGIR
jgi:hypothetical protein